MKKPEKKDIEHEEDGSKCGCYFREDEYPCQTAMNEYNTACDDWEKYLEYILKKYSITL